MYLGIDIGTSCVKAVLIDDADKVVGEGRADLAMSRPFPLWSEQSPHDWWTATNFAVGKLDPSLRRGVQAIGLAGQMHGAVLLDHEDAPLRSAILWNDGRSEAQCNQLETVAPTSRTITGNPAMPGFTAPKLLWVAQNEPDIFEATKTVLLPKDYIRLRMTGEKASDMSDASGTLWLDVAGRVWSETMLHSTGLDRSHMPSVVEGTKQTGHLRSEVAQSWGMACIPVAAGGGDNAAGAVGVGVVHAGDAFICLGTSGVIFVVTDQFRPKPDAAVHAFAHALPETWHQMSVMLSAASCLDWAARLLGLVDVPNLLALAQSTATSGGVVFLPYLNGERTPHNDPHAQGVLFGLTSSTQPGNIAQAILEGVAFGMRDGLDALLAAGSEIGMLTVAGGGSRSNWWGNIIATALDRPLAYRAGGDVGPALGAARLARLSIGEGSIADVCTAPSMTALIEPDPSLKGYLGDRHAIFRTLYQRLKPIFKPIQRGPHD